MGLPSSRLLRGGKLRCVKFGGESFEVSHLTTPSLSAGPGVPEEDPHAEAEEALGEPEDEGGDDHRGGAGSSFDPRRHHLRHRQQRRSTVTGPWLGGQGRSQGEAAAPPPLHQPTPHLVFIYGTVCVSAAGVS